MNRTMRLLSMLIAALLLVAGCSTAEEAGEEPTADAPVAVTSEPAPVESETEIIVPMESEVASEPAGGSASTTNQSILELASENPQLSQLVAAVQAAGLTDALEQAGPLTVFAPNNDAFAALDQSDLTTLLTDPTSLGGILQYHVVEGMVPSSDLTDGQTLTTLEGSELPVSVNGSTVMVGDATVVQPDIQAGNGVIHVIDSVLQP